MYACKIKSRESKIFLSTHIHSGIIHKCQKTEITQVCINRWLNRYNVIHTYNGMLLSNQREWCFDACYKEKCGFDPCVGKIHWSRKLQPLQYSSLRNTRDRGTWWTAVLGVAKSWKWLSTHTHNRLDLENTLTEISQNWKKNYLWCHLYEVSRIRQILGDRNCYNHLGAGPIGNHCLMGIAFLFEMMITFWK